MTVPASLVLIASLALSGANGANDVSKGVATLVGSGVSDLRRAVLWGSSWTGAGGLLGAVFGGAMLTTFGSGLAADGAAPTIPSAIAALAGAAGWVLIATRAGLPVSTTHAIVGSVLGSLVAAQGAGAVRWDVLGAKVVVPLLVSPLVALALTGLALRLWRRCDAAGPTRLPLDRLHWLSSGATCLARGMNDAPKIVALGLAASALGSAAGPRPSTLYAAVTLAMVAGSLVGGRRVSRVLAEDVTPMDPREGLAANLATAALVTTGAFHGLPMSTTHVATGGIFGAGVHRGTLDRGALRGILLAWIVTLPAAALLGAFGSVLAGLVAN